MNMSAILASPEPETPRQQQQPAPPPPPPPAVAASSDPIASASNAATPMPPLRRHDDDVSVSVAGSGTPKNDMEEPMYTSTTTSIRRNASGQTSSVYSGNKIRHLKKEDGIPLWRKDIQYDFLKLVFEDETKCFTKASDGTKGHTFADVYIDAMAKSSKCSKILKEKLLQDQDGAISMAMVCLLVNVGRMNTTLNFFPEMRAQLRTYHSIPALQAHQDPNAYKQLQDAPRLKSILKGATEDEPQPATMDEIKAASIPRTNPVNLIFVMSQYAPKISELHFPPPRDFFDLVMRPSLGSASRARAFLWLIWWYLESDFSKEDSLRNPFGPGEYESEEVGADAVPLRVPTLKNLTEEQTAEENIDTEDEKMFGEIKRKERISILASEPSPAMTALKRARKEKGLTTGHGAHASDDEGSEMGGYHRGAMPPSMKNISALQQETGSEYARSPSPASGRGFQAVNTQPKPPGDMRINNLLNSDHIMPDQSPPRSIAPTPSALTSVPPAKKGPGRGNWRRNKNKGDAPGSTMMTPSGGRGIQENHHVPLLPNTGQINFASGGLSAPEYNSAPSGGGSFNVFSNKGATQAMSPPQHGILSSSSSYPLNSGGGSLVNNGMTHIPTPSYQAQKRNRGVTQHQSAIMSHRKQQIDYTLDSRIRKAHIRFRRAREGESAVVRAWKRIRTLDTAYDSEEESIKIKKARARGEKDEDDGNTTSWGRSKGKTGEAEADAFQNDVDAWRRPKCLYAGYVRANGEQVDLGEEVRTLAKSFRRLSRRLERWGDNALPGAAMMRRIDMEARGGYELQRKMEIEQEEYYERMEAEEETAPAVRAPPKRQRKRRPPVVKIEQATGVGGGDDDQQAEHPDEDVDGRQAAELDEEDRELLGEVDADLDESEDEDGDGDGDGDSDGDGDGDGDDQEDVDMDD